ncbi:pantothenate kinase [Ameyamaea chiangmaiensis NBRC 103196]|uniref:Pantothenate kinase n=1 Tax=Ameyamaea chiangmaiensis TaxID=442969 RepID=A0A850P7P7_9PROT|nr:type I pantothenate kinase [Ameyamaea chiangmaiensis]MBS4074143.1 type I pantothenate kinase [Ameyamaea chiangmaiensis]NVN39954.1 type I pantothenate kinase [Ameyamaea chiangmaiensis]GBQ71023.1 pantothenate kinase [Ameyamaea chiangmaiensis NBRC 103196]
MSEPSGLSFSPAYQVFGRDDWRALRKNTPLTLTPQDLERIRGLGVDLSLQEVEDIYLPLSRLLNLHVRAARTLHTVQDSFLNNAPVTSPYIIGIAGSVAAGKSTLARVLRTILSHWPDHPRVDLVTTDGFLHPLDTLIERKLAHRKGFPESYDLPAMIAFLAAIKSGAPNVSAPVYSHIAYDIVPHERQSLDTPDILIFEGLNVLQQPHGTALLASDFFDFSIYLDAEEPDLEAWYIDRFLLLQRTAFQKPSSYFHNYRDLSVPEATTLARRFWSDINLINLRENIRPTRERARLILHKAGDHRVDRVALRLL